ncbi:unnamed protein product [Leuciscus chuanchicus]
MGQTDSSPNYESEALWFYNQALWTPCLLPDVGIDESLLKYSGSDSNAVLQAYSNDMANSVPGYIRGLGSVWGPMASIPNAVGLGALVISLIMELFIKSSGQNRENTYSLLQRVFGEEKASSVRDTMSEYLKRHRTHIKDDQKIREEISGLEKQLSNHLTILTNSLLHDDQMSSRGFKIWVNGAAFHVQMLIHEARLNIQTGKPASVYLNAIEAAINLYLQELDDLLEKYKTYKINSGIFSFSPEHHEFIGYQISQSFANSDVSSQMSLKEKEGPSPILRAGWLILPGKPPCTP